MQVRWRDLVIIDYEVDFPAATGYELGLYSSGLQLFPKVVLGIDRVWGRLRRPGLVDIPEALYEEILGEFAASCLTSSSLYRMSTTMTDLISSLTQACDTLDEDLAADRHPKPELLESATSRLGHLMAFHVLNWVLPIDEIISRLQLLLGSRKAARETLLSMMVPFTSSHVLDALEGSDFQDRAAPAHALSKRQAQRLARRTLSIWLQSHGNLDDLVFLTNLARLGRLVAEEEEQRRRIQTRWMNAASLLPPGLFEYGAKSLTSQCVHPEMLSDNDQCWDWLK